MRVDICFICFIFCGFKKNNNQSCKWRHIFWVFFFSLRKYSIIWNDKNYGKRGFFPKYHYFLCQKDIIIKVMDVVCNVNHSHSIYKLLIHFKYFAGSENRKKLTMIFWHLWGSFQLFVSQFSRSLKYVAGNCI